MRLVLRVRVHSVASVTLGGRAGKVKDAGEACVRRDVAVDIRGVAGGHGDANSRSGRGGVWEPRAKGIQVRWEKWGAQGIGQSDTRRERAAA